MSLSQLFQRARLLRSLQGQTQVKVRDRRVRLLLNGRGKCQSCIRPILHLRIERAQFILQFEIPRIMCQRFLHPDDRSPNLPRGRESPRVGSKHRHSQRMFLGV